MLKFTWVSSGVQELLWLIRRREGGVANSAMSEVLRLCRYPSHTSKIPIFQYESGSQALSTRKCTFPENGLYNFMSRCGFRRLVSSTFSPKSSICRKNVAISCYRGQTACGYTVKLPLMCAAVGGLYKNSPGVLFFFWQPWEDERIPLFWI